jgi:hypothetical protein
MKTNYFFIFLVIFAFLIGSLATSCDSLFGSDDDSNKTTEIPFRNITLGASGQWDGIDPVIVDPENDNEIAGAGNDIVAVYVAHDDDFFYWRMDVADGSPGTNHGYGIGGGYPDHRRENAIEARVFSKTDDSSSARVWLRDANLDWQVQSNFSDDHFHVGTYVEMKIPRNLIHFDPIIIFAYIRDEDVGDFADETDDSPALSF